MGISEGVLLKKLGKGIENDYICFDSGCQKRRVLKMESFGEQIRKLREEKGLLLRQLAAAMETDTGLVSKFEKGERKPTREWVVKVANFFNVPVEGLLVAWLSEKIVYQVGDDDEVALKALQVAERRIRYGKKDQEGEDEEELT